MELVLITALGVGASTVFGSFIGFLFKKTSGYQTGYQHLFDFKFRRKESFVDTLFFSFLIILSTYCPLTVSILREVSLTGTIMNWLT